MHLAYPDMPGETELERALNLAAEYKDFSEISKLLRDDLRTISMEDRRRLADFIEGKFVRPPGRRGKDRKTLIDQMAKERQDPDLYRKGDAYRCLKMHWHRCGRPYGGKTRFIERVAKRFHVDVEWLENKSRREGLK